MDHSEPFRDSLFEQAKPKLSFDEIKRVRRIARLSDSRADCQPIKHVCCSQIRHLLGSAFSSVSHRPLDAFLQETSDDEDSDEEHDVANNSVTNKASQTFTKSHTPNSKRKLTAPPPQLQPCFAYGFEGN